MESKCSGMLPKVLLVCLAGLLAWAYQSSRPPPPKICGSKDGPPVTASRIRLRDGRYLAYKESGVPKESAKHRVVFIHGFGCCRHDVVCITRYLSREIVENYGIYIVSFDRAGYGESDPNPKRTVRSTAFDIEELADQLGLGSKFYVVGYSMGGEIAWTCLKYMPHRLEAAAIVAPVVNFWWRGFPSNLSGQVFKQVVKQDQWALRVAHYLPWLVYWWNTQKLFPRLGLIENSPKVYSPHDLDLKKTFEPSCRMQATQQGEFESLHRDLTVGFGSWEFDPTELKNPFPDSKGPRVHLWQGDEDLLCPAQLQRYIARQLPWIKYHEVAGAGHLFPCAHGFTSLNQKYIITSPIGRQASPTNLVAGDAWYLSTGIDEVLFSFFTMRVSISIIVARKV